MAQEYQKDLKNLAPKLKAIHGELLRLELSTSARSLEQAALSVAMAWAWCDVVDMTSDLPDQL
jgi:hypothetical protein